MAALFGYLAPGIPPSRLRWGWWKPVFFLALLLLVVAGLRVEVSQVESRMDAVTGSMTWRTVWLFGITSGSRVDVSPLELRLKRNGIPWTPSWRLLHNTHKNLIGGATCYECGSAPAIYRLSPVFAQFAAASSDAELREFVRIMQSGTEAEQRTAVDAAAEKGLRTDVAVERGSTQQTELQTAGDR